VNTLRCWVAASQRSPGGRRGRPVDRRPARPAWSRLTPARWNGPAAVHARLGQFPCDAVRVWLSTWISSRGQASQASPFQSSSVQFHSCVVRAALNPVVVTQGLSRQVPRRFPGGVCRLPRVTAAASVPLTPRAPHSGQRRTRSPWTPDSSLPPRKPPRPTGTSPSRIPSWCPRQDRAHSHRRLLATPQSVHTPDCSRPRTVS